MTEKLKSVSSRPNINKMLFQLMLLINSVPVESPVAGKSVSQILGFTGSASDALRMISYHEYLTNVEFKKLARLVQRLMIKEGFVDFKLGHGYLLIARLFGYVDVGSLRSYSNVCHEEMIRNFRVRRDLTQNVFDPETARYHVPEVRQFFIDQRA